MKKQILESYNAHLSRSMGPNFRQVIPSAIDNIDPFVFLDHFGPIEKKPGGQGVPPHPHAGIATITYLFSGSNRHQDSYGHDEMIYAGDIAWMQAGKGIVHSEGMNENRTESEVIHGLQFWISLPAKYKLSEPDFFYHRSSALPTININEATVKVLCGEIQGHQSPIKSLSPAYIFEVKIPAFHTIEIPITSGNSCGLYIVTGSINIEERTLLQTTLTVFDETGDSLSLSANTDCHFMLFGGTPLKEPVVGYASYVMNSKEQIQQVMLDYEMGKMGIINI